MGAILHLAVNANGIAEAASFGHIDLTELPGTRIVHFPVSDQEVNDHVHGHVVWKDFVRHGIGLLQSMDQVHMIETVGMTLWNAAVEYSKTRTKIRKPRPVEKKKKRRAATR